MVKPAKSSSSRPLSYHIPSYCDQSFGDGIVEPEVKARLVHLVAPHVDSFNYFLEHGIDEIITDIPPFQIELKERTVPNAAGSSSSSSSSSNPNLNVEKPIDCSIKFQYEGLNISKPTRKEDSTVKSQLTPAECREGSMTYAGNMMANISVEVGKNLMSLIVNMGDLPIMVMSDRCNLSGMSSKQLLKGKEEANEVGGYFIINGNERVIRLLQVPRRNYATALERSSFKNRGHDYSDKGVTMRCARKDQSSLTVTLHALISGGTTLRFVIRKSEFLLPVILVAKAMVDLSDKELFDRIIQNDSSNIFLATRLELMLRDFKTYNLSTKAHCQSYLGSLFRAYLPIGESTSDMEAGKMLISRFLFVHVDTFADKLESLLHMLRKLYSLVQGRCTSDNADALMNHELLLPGHLITMYMKEKMEELLLNVKQQIDRDFRVNKTKALHDMQNAAYFDKMFKRFGIGIGPKIGTFLSTGNIVSSTGMDLMQVSGYTIVAERLNMFRYMSHFQSVHRGQFFTTMKTTTVRKLLPESWGFLCPVHTPDGSPCGLLNHLAKDAVIIAYPTNKKLPCSATGSIEVPYNFTNSRSHLQALLSSLGMVAAGAGSGDGQLILTPEYLPVLFDGVVLGGLKKDEARGVVSQLRYLKTRNTPPNVGDEKSALDPTLELAYLPPTEHKGAYPGLYICSAPGRMVRPVMQLKSQTVEWIGPLEQVFMEVACLQDDIRPDTTHMEMEPTAMLSHIASMTPFSDNNQSPRNMYQCQMGKQTMGTPVHGWKQRADNKLYRIQNPQAAVVQTRMHRQYGMDEYPQGTNAIVAVISYTGYDMEDAMIISKGSYERGFGHGSLYKTHIFNLEEEEKMVRTSPGDLAPSLRFSNLKTAETIAAEALSPKGRNKGNDINGDRNAVLTGNGEPEKICEELDWDGLPCEGTKVDYGSPLVCLVDINTGVSRIITHKDHESARIETVRIIGSNEAARGATAKGSVKKATLRKVSITFRYCRNPVIGDKFSSRHGQKGTLSVLWPQESMPFTESGMTPDLLINPHAFPSRMTIGMLIESMAGKSGAINGVFQDSTPFQFHEENLAIDHFGEQLRSVGYHYYGSEPMYNGITGNVMQADIFIGVVYYQRLRHMVSDKSQVRSTGPVMALTRQPVKGRKKHGGIRLGEMERDALISHGVSFCLQDRLMNCSDAHLAHVCALCGSLITVYAQPPLHSSCADTHQSVTGSALNRNRNSFSNSYVQTCDSCQSQSAVHPIKLPYVFRYLVNELAAMGIKLTLKLTE